MSDRPSEQDTAWSHMLAQHQDRPRIEALVKALHGPLNLLAQSLIAMRLALDMDTAEGPRLDLIGSIVGLSREFPAGLNVPYFGFITQPSGRAFGRARMRREGEPITTAYKAGDPEFRRLIRAKIALNNSHGTADDIAQAARGYYGAQEASARDYGVGRVQVWVGAIPDPDDALNRVLPVLPKAAGVATAIVFYLPARAFGFAGQLGVLGFGQGVLSRTPLSNLAAI